MIGFVSVENLKPLPISEKAAVEAELFPLALVTPDLPYPGLEREAAADIKQIPSALSKLFDIYQYKSSSEIVAVLKQLGITEILTNGSDEPSYDPKEVAEKLIIQKFVKCPITPRQARWFVDKLLAVVSQIFEQENRDNLVARQLLDTTLNRILGKKVIILRNGRNELAVQKSNFFDWIMTACELGDIVLLPEEEQILKKYLESNKMSARSELSYVLKQLRP